MSKPFEEYRELSASFEPERDTCGMCRLPYSKVRDGLFIC
ncbi:hypothetical protein ACLB1N_11465 [Escherichia coli]